MTPDLKALAMAAVEAEYKCTNAKGRLKKLELGQVSSLAFSALRDAATPERILQFENEVLDDVLKVLGRFSLQTEIIAAAIRALKTKEPT